MTHTNTSQSDDYALIVYASPGSDDRLRLDKEHRAVERALADASVSPERVTRLHASTLKDILKELQKRPYSILQFSGHGAKNGIVVESDGSDDGLFLEQGELCSVLRLAAPHLKLAIFMSCFSEEMGPQLIKEVPFVVAVSGAADDEFSIKFISVFYEIYFGTGSILRAVTFACAAVRHLLKVYLLRRGLPGEGPRLLISPVEKSSPFDDPPSEGVLIDITDVDSDLQRIGVPRDEFVTLLTHKIRIHAWAFRYPRENALFSFGPYFALFSWANPHDRIVCNKVLKLRHDVSEEDAERWMGLIVSYHDLYVLEYRRPATKFIAVEKNVRNALGRFHGVKNFFSPMAAWL